VDTSEEGSAVQEAHEKASAVSGGPPSGALLSRSADRGDTKSGRGEPDSTSNGHVGYDRGPNGQALSERYDIAVAKGQAGKLHRLEREFGSDRLSRWVDEGMTVGTMAKPRDMEAFRKRQEERPDEVPTDIERRNEASRRRNTGQKQDDGPVGETGVPDEVRSVISSPGRSMDESVQREMESKMGGNFGDVQLHTGPTAASAADAINARAFTIGNHVAFNSGEYQSDSPEGKKVLAHELTHVRQQTEGAVSLLQKAGAEHTSPHDLTGAGIHIQPKLRISSPDDPAEQEAERVAEAVMEMDGSSEQADREDETAPGGQPETPVSLSESVSRSSGSGNVSGDTESLVRSGVQGGGKPLPEGTRSEFESNMGADFSDVRVHTGSKADEAARSINAEAYTMGNSIAFATGNYNPQSTFGKKLLAHELTHVVQQTPANESLRKTTHIPRKDYIQREGGKGDTQSMTFKYTPPKDFIGKDPTLHTDHRVTMMDLSSLYGRRAQLVHNEVLENRSTETYKELVNKVVSSKWWKSNMHQIINNGYVMSLPEYGDLWSTFSKTGARVTYTMRFITSEVPSDTVKKSGEGVQIALSTESTEEEEVTLKQEQSGSVEGETEGEGLTITVKGENAQSVSRSQVEKFVNSKDVAQQKFIPFRVQPKMKIEAQADFNWLGTDFSYLFSEQKFPAVVGFEPDMIIEFAERLMEVN
jgi:hypothetical protein